MFLGHIAVGFAATRVAPRAPLAVTMSAAMLLDLLWPIFLLLGIERVRIAPGITAVSPLDFESYPWSHSLLATLAWAVVFGLTYRAFTRDARGAIWVGVAVASHWVLDVVAHRPDMPLWPGGGPRIGLDLWRSIPATVAIESVMLAFGLWLYLRVTRARNAMGNVLLWGFVGLMLFGYMSSLAGPPPPSVPALAWVSLVLGWVSVLWMIGVDRTRETRVPA